MSINFSTLLSARLDSAAVPPSTFANGNPINTLKKRYRSKIGALSRDRIAAARHEGLIGTRWHRRCRDWSTDAIDRDNDKVFFRANQR